MEAYFELRHEILRKPWGMVKGTEQADDDVTSLHYAAFDDDNNMIGVGRLHFNSPEEGQIRFMAVSQQGKGVGKAIMHAMEQEAARQNAKSIVLHARELAVPFYEKLGYQITNKSYLLFGEIQHWEMRKGV
jgi:predicted GNAT family N-acyltransferase